MVTGMQNRLVAKVLREIADLLEIEGEEAGKAATYRRAAWSIESLPRDVAVIRREGGLLAIPGVGPKLAKKIEEILDTGTCSLKERLQSRIPGGVVDLMEVPGIGPRTAGMLYRALGIRGPDDLERALLEGRLRTLPGFGEKREKAIRDGLAQFREGSSRFLLGSVLPWAKRWLGEVRSLPTVIRAEIAGSVRRGRETVGDLDIVVAAGDAARVLAAIPALSGVERVIHAAGNHARVLLEAHLHVDFIVTEPALFPYALLFATGSLGHVKRLQALARQKGMVLTARGLFVRGVFPPFDAGPADEEGIYHALGLSFVPPELREDWGEIEAASEGRDFQLVQLEDIKGDLHLHSTSSDGAESIEEIAMRARARGYSYIAIADHSRSLAVARGLSIDRLLEQGERIARLNRELAPFRILWGAEVDILKDGSLDYPDEVLERLDLVIASVHSVFNMDREAMTRRIINVIRNRHVDVIGHLTGRLIGRRRPYDLDMDAILREASLAGTAMEINSSPDRLDLCDRHARMAGDHGVPVVISTDSHAPESLDDMVLGVMTARRGWLTKGDVLNARPLEGLMEHLKGRSPAGDPGPGGLR